MNKEEMILAVKDNLRLETDDYNLTISDTILTVCDYCNLDPECIPDILEPIIRKKVKGIRDYEEAMGTGYQQEVKSVKEGDGTVEWAQTEGNTKASIYSLSESDKKALRRHRRLRGYV